MCGICGELRFGDARVSASTTAHMEAALRHRGPDAAGYGAERRQAVHLLALGGNRCTMANSLEPRSPFLNTALVEYVSGLPDSFKLRRFTTKVILRKAVEDLLPPSVARRGKMGCGVPLGAWFRDSLRDYVGDLLLDSSARYRAFLSAPYVCDLVGRHQGGEADLGLQLWSVLCFEVWLRRLPGWTQRCAA